MSGEGGSVDLDLLADYVGGALVGTPDEARIAQLIARDPAWRRAADDLSRALVAVSADLAVLRGTPEPIPAEIAGQIDEALRHTRQGVGERVLTRREGVHVRPSKWRRRALPLTLAAVVVAFGAIAVPSLLAPNAMWEQPSKTDAATEQATPLTLADTPVGSTGRKYDAESFPAQRITGSPSATGRANSQYEEPKVGSLSAATPPELMRLREAGPFTNCLREVTKVQPGKVQWVDLAYFDGKPAAVFFILNGTAKWVVVTEPSCGIDGPAVIHRAALA